MNNQKHVWMFFWVCTKRIVGIHSKVPCKTRSMTAIMLHPYGDQPPGVTFHSLSENIHGISPYSCSKSSNQMVHDFIWFPWQTGHVQLFNRLFLSPDVIFHLIIHSSSGAPEGRPCPTNSSAKWWWSPHLEPWSHGISRSVSTKIAKKISQFLLEMVWEWETTRRLQSSIVHIFLVI